MKPAITLLVRTRNGAATAIAEAGLRRAADLGLRVKIVPLASQSDAGSPVLVGAWGRDDESVTAVVPVEFSATHHEAWCFLCQLALLRPEVSFAILVLGAAGNADFQARQHALIERSVAPRSRQVRTAAKNRAA